MRLIRKGTLLGLILSFFMVLTANAEETTKNQEVKKEFYGEIRTTFANISNESEDGKAFFDMTSDAILGFKAEQMIGNLKSTAKLEFEIESFDNAILHPKKVYITLESDSLLGRLGRNDPSGHTVGREFLEGFEQSYEVGVSFGRGDYLEIQHKKAGLSFIVGQNGNAADINKGTPESVLAVFYETKFGEMPFKISYIDISEEVLSDASSDPSQSNLLLGHETYKSYSFGFGIPVSSALIAFNYDQNTNNYDAPASLGKVDNVVTTTIINFDWKFGEKAGMSVSYGIRKTDVEKREPLTETRTDLGIVYPNGPVKFFAGYSSQATKDDNQQLELTDTQYGVGMIYKY